MAVAASIDVVLTAKTDKFSSDLKKGEQAMSRFGRAGKSISGGFADISKRFTDVFSPQKIIGSFIAFESIKKVVGEIKKRLAEGFFDQRTTQALQGIGASWNKIKDSVLTVVAKTAAAFAPGISLVLQGWAGIFTKIAEYADGIGQKINDWIRSIDAIPPWVTGGSQGAPVVVGLTDESQKRFDQARERGAALKQQFTPLEEKLRAQLAEVATLRRGNFIDDDTARRAIADINQQWKDFIDEGVKATEQYNREQLELARKSQEQQLRLQEEQRRKQEDVAREMQRVAEEKQRALSDAFQDNVLQPLRDRADRIGQMVATDVAPQATEAGSLDFATKYLDIQRDNENRAWQQRQLNYLQLIATNTAKAWGIELAEAKL